MIELEKFFTELSLFVGRCLQDVESFNSKLQARTNSILLQEDIMNKMEDKLLLQED